MLNRLSSSFHIPQFTIKFFFSGPNELLAAGDFLIANLIAPHKKLLENCLRQAPWLGRFQMRAANRGR
jgi:hypothetical protein